LNCTGVFADEPENSTQVRTPTLTCHLGKSKNHFPGFEKPCLMPIISDRIQLFHQTAVIGQAPYDLLMKFAYFQTILVRQGFFMHFKFLQVTLIQP
jgi:hypothetical protein